MRYWLMKSEPDVFSLTDLKNRPNQTACWEGVRNYQARNFMRDDMQVGDRILYYHSNCAEPGIVGLAEVARKAYPDHFARDPESHYYDPKASEEDPRWFMVDVRFRAEFPQTITLKQLKDDEALKEMKVVQRGQRLSVQPVTETEYHHVCDLAQLPKSKR